MKGKRHLLKLMRKMAENSFKNGQILDIKVKDYLKEIKKLPLAEAIFLLKGYLKALKMLKQRSTLVIETAMLLSNTQINKIKKEFKQPVSDVEIKVNKKVLGGLRIQLGDKLYDDSILNKIYQVGGIIKA